MRCASTRVLPDPAPATMSRGDSACSTAARCCGLSPASRSCGAAVLVAGSTEGPGELATEALIVATTVPGGAVKWRLRCGHAPGRQLDGRVPPWHTPSRAEPPSLFLRVPDPVPVMA